MNPFNKYFITWITNYCYLEQIHWVITKLLRFAKAMFSNFSVVVHIISVDLYKNMAYQPILH